MRCYNTLLKPAMREWGNEDAKVWRHIAAYNLPWLNAAEQLRNSCTDLLQL
jgi:hypothetical protein